VLTGGEDTVKKAKSYDAIIGAVTQSVHKSTNLEGVLESTVQTIIRNIPKVKHISIYMVEGKEAVLKAYRGYPDWFIKRVRRIPYPNGFTWKTIMDGKPRYCADVDKDELIGPAGREVGTKSYVSMPIHSEGKTVGCISINSFRKNAFNKKEINLLEAVAQQIEIAVSNARHAEALRKAHDELEILIEERKRMEAALQESEERYRTLVENAPEAIVVLDVERGCFTDANENAARLFKLTRAELLSHGPIDLSLPVQPDGRPSSESALEKIRQAIEGGTPRFEWTHRNAQGEDIPCEVSLVRLPSATRTLIRGSVVDITERKRVERIARESEQRFRLLVESVKDYAIFMLDTNGFIVSWNAGAEHIMGYKSEEIIGKHFSTFYPEEDIEHGRPQHNLGIAVAEGRYEDEGWRVRKDGSKFWANVVITALRDEYGNLRGFSKVTRDITERRKVEEERLKFSKLESVGTLAGGIAHDFNNLLTGIMTAVSSTKIDPHISADAYENLTEAEKICIQAKRLTQQLLTFSKGGTPVKKLASIERIIRESVSLALRGSNVKCNISIEGDLWDAEVDGGQISQAITNLLINADQAMPQGGLIDLTAHNIDYSGDRLSLKEGRYVRITVEDEGIGIPQEHIARIFDPYFTTKQKGSGLGLAVVYSIIKNHNGYIDIESQLGKGTKFHVYIPASPKRVEGERVERKKIRSGEGRVLIMDDEGIIRNAAGRALVRIGYEVEYAKDGAEAIELYTRAKDENRPFDVVIMDLTVPGKMGGKEAIEKLISIDPDVRAIVSSGYSNDSVMSEYRRYGFKGVLSKPYSIGELTDTLHKVMEEMVYPVE
jgi:two-component system cell cycle sensor histidine kinase/response regulator CckA